MKIHKSIFILGVVSVLWLVQAPPTVASVCGDADYNETGPDIGDLVYLVNYMFNGGPPPPQMHTTDVNGDGSVTPDIADLVYLVNYMFHGGPAPICLISTPSTTTIIPQDSSTVIQEYDTTTGVVTLDSSSYYAQQITVGDIIIGQDDVDAPNGFLRKVTSKTAQGGSIVLETEPATMMEAFEEIDIEKTHPLNPTDVKSVELYNGTTFQPNKDGQTFDVSLNCVLYDQDGDPGTTDDQIRLDGQYAFTAALFAKIQISWFTLQKFETGIETNEDANIDLIANLQWEFNEAVEFDLAEFHFGAIPVGGVVWLVPTLTVEAHIHGDLTVTFQTGITYTQQLRYGFGWTNDASFYDISESTRDFTFTPPQFTAEFNFEPGVSLNASCLLYGVAGPYMAGKAGFHFQSILNADPCNVELTFDLEAILYAVVGIECDILGLDYNREYLLYTHPIGEWVYPIGGCVTDIDGNVYQTITIGTQEWMAENLKVTHYRNGDPIPHVIDDNTWEGLSTGAYCEYDNDPANVATYGRMYNWYAVDDSRNIAPEGWHVPSDAEWKQLEVYLGMSQAEADATGLRGTDEGGKLKETGTIHWSAPNVGGTNESGFTALPGGYRSYHGTVYHMRYYAAYFWSSTGGWRRYLHHNNSQVYRSSLDMRYGHSIRCVKDWLGTVIIDPSPDSINASWSLAGPDGYNASGTGDETLTNLDPGDYTVTWGAVSGWTTPSNSTQALVDETVTFGGTYVQEGSGTVTDIDGNVYSTVTIGSQVWMAENLIVTHYLNGDTTEAYYIYNNDESNVATYGRLYNWYAVNDSRNIAPAGWHVPSDSEWQVLIDYLGGDGVAGGKMKEAGTTHWSSPNTGATDESGFTALPGGFRQSGTGHFHGIGTHGYFWSSTGNGGSTAWTRHLYHDNAGVYRVYNYKDYGMSVRCVRD